MLLSASGDVLSIFVEITEEFFNDKYTGSSADPAVRTARAPRMVVILADALGSPVTLKRSELAMPRVSKKLEFIQS